MSKKIENLKKIIFFSCKKSKNLKCFFFQQKKSSWCLNIRTMRFDQSSPVQPNPEEKIWKYIKKSFFFTLQKSENFKEILFLPEKKYYHLSFLILRGRDLTRASGPARFRIQGGYPEPDGRSPNERKKSLSLILDALREQLINKRI